MPLEDAIRFIYKDFSNKTKKITQSVYQHPDAIQTLLKTLGDNRSLTVLQYDHIIKYLSARREVQRKMEIGEDANDMDYADSTSFSSIQTPVNQGQQSAPVSNPQDDLQKKILEILNKKPLMQQLTKRVETKSQPMTQKEKEDLKNKLLQDDKIKQAMSALRNSKKLSK